MRFLLAALCAVFFTGPAFAGINGWTHGAGGAGVSATCPGPFASLSAAASCVGGIPTPPGVAGPYSVTSVTLTDPTPPTLFADIAFNRATAGPQTASYGFTDSCSTLGRQWNATYGGCAEICVAPDTLNTTTGMCDAPPDCGVFEGVVADRFYSDSEVGDAVCASPPGEEVLGCEALHAAPMGFAACSGGQCFARLAFTGGQCAAEPDITGETIVEEPGFTNCVSGGSGGVAICAAKSSQNCGTVNGEAVCLESVPPGRCAFLGNGGLVCGSDADGPTESDGTTPATPDGTFTARGDDAEEDSFRYFGPGTVASSGTPVSGGGVGDTTTDEVGDDGATCVGCELELPEVEDGDPANVVANDAIATLMSGAFGDVMEGVAADLPGGACPTTSFEAYETTFTVDAHCDLVESQRAVLEAVFLLGWALLGFRVLMET